MKKNYTKPQICVEVFTMDQPIAAGCSPIDPSVLAGIQALGYYVDTKTCTTVADEVIWGNDTICYHTSVQNIYNS